MPKHRTHRLVSKLILGKAYSNVDRWMDEPYRWLGRRHRVLRHDPLSLYLRYGPTPEFLAGLLHVALDEGDSAVKRKLRRRAKH